MLVDGRGEEMEAEFRAGEEHHQSPTPFLPERNTPTVTSNGEMPDTPAHLVSPLKRKQSAVHNDRLGIDMQGARKSASQMPVGMKDIQISQQLVMTSAKKTPLRARTESLEVAQELMMVSVQKRPKESRYESDNSGDESNERDSAESYSESECEGEEVSEEDEEEFTPEEDSEQDENEVEEEEAPQTQEDGIVAEGAGCDNHLQRCIKTGPEMSRRTVDTSVKSADSIMAEARQELSHPGQESQGDGDENISDAPRTRQQMAEMASQALQLSVTTGMRTVSKAEVSLSDDCRPEIQGNEVAVNRSSFQQQQSQVVHLGPHDDTDSSWHPRVPDTSGFAIEVDDEIVDSPTPAPIQERQVIRHRSSRRSSGFGSSQLTIVRSRRNSPIPEELINLHDTQGSVELGAPQRIISVASESLLSYQPEIPETQFSVVGPQLSYMERALGQLGSPIRRPNMNRTKSTPAPVFAQHGQSSDGLMAGGIAMKEAFHHTVSPLKIGSCLPTLREESSSEEKSLKSLTRKASVNLGTMPGSARKRTVSLQFKPPFRPSTL